MNNKEKRALAQKIKNYVIMLSLRDDVTKGKVDVIKTMPSLINLEKDYKNYKTINCLDDIDRLVGE